MARIIRPILSFLSTAVFFATFIVVGDVLIAATAAILTAIVQFAIRESAYRRSAFLIWASLAIVLAITGLSLKGDEAHASGVANATATSVVVPCACHAPARVIEAARTVSPTL